MPIPLIVPVVIAGAAAVGWAIGGKPADSSPAPLPPPHDPLPPAVPKRCEPADTWYEKAAEPQLQSQGAAGMSRHEWDKLSCSEKKQIMALGPFAINTILISRTAAAARAQIGAAEHKAADAAKAAESAAGKAAKAAKKALHL